MVGRFLCVLFISLASITSAQEESYIQPGLLAASLTFSPSTMLNHSDKNFYASVFAEYMLDKQFSFRSDSYVFLNSESDAPLIQNGLRSYFGIAYHVNKGNWDASLGFQPGITVMNFDANSSNLKTSVKPSAALRLGTTYYIWKYFHFFANLSYTRSKMTVIDRGPLQTDELIFSAGLGLQIQTKKRK